jgi:hypothetical protein
MIYQGGCHCGKIAFEVEGELTQAIECNCSHCSKKGYLLWFLPREQLRLSTPEDALATYTFNKHVIKHHYCPDCGCAPFGVGASPSGAATAAVNVRYLEGVTPSALTIVPADGRSY